MGGVAAGRNTSPAAAGHCNILPEADRTDPAGRTPAAGRRRRRSSLAEVVDKRRRGLVRPMDAVRRPGRRRSGLAQGRWAERLWGVPVVGCE